MKKLFTCLLLFIFLNPAISYSQSNSFQKRANHWYFGMFAGLDFTNGAPVTDMNGKINTAEGTSAISDTAGNLLLYTDGITVFNRMHDTMPNGVGLMGDVSSTQSALIVPRSNHPNNYYIFTTAADGGSDGFRYSTVDLTLDGGLGDIVYKNVPIRNATDEKISAVGNPSGTGYWVMSHDWGTDAFYAYFLSDTGINMTPVISHVGSVHSNSNFQNTYGQMKFSPNGQKLALGIGYQQMFELFDFNNTTGVVSHPITFNTGKSSYGLEFSPDGTKLYTTRFDNLNDVYYLDQFNLSAGNDAQIIASQVTISNADVMRQLQLGPDGKIYMAKFNTPYLSVINNPNGLGNACNFQDNGFLLDSAQSGLTLCGLGLPGFVQSFFFEPTTPVSAFSSDDTVICPGHCVNFHDLSLNNVSEWHWSFPGANPDTSSAENPQNICYPSSGFYPVTLITGNGVGYDTTTISGYVEVRQAPPVSISVNGDTMQAFNAVTYQWYVDGNIINGANTGFYIAPGPGSYTVVITDVYGCVATSNAIVITGIADLSEAGIKVYPVPAGDYLNVALTDETGVDAAYVVRNILGETVPVLFISEKNMVRIDIQNLAAGYYTLELISKAPTHVIRFIKQ